MKLFHVLALISACTAFCHASGNDPTEKGVPTSPLKIYSAGIGLGAAIPINDDLKGVSERFALLSFENVVYLKPHADLFVDVDWFIPRKNFGATAGIDFHPALKDIVPFFGVGLGANYFDHRGEPFGANFGPTITGHAGCLVTVTRRFAMRFRVPVQVVIDKWQDQTVGFELGLLRSSRFKNIKQLNYE